MKKTLLFLIIALYCADIFAQSDIDGIYVDKYNERHRIELSEGRFRFIRQNAWQPYIEYLCADANYEWVDDEFIEFHSEKPSNVIDSLLEVKRVNSDTIAGARRKKNIKVIMPDIYTTELNITVFYNAVKLTHLAGLHFGYLPTDEWKKGETKCLSKHETMLSVPVRTDKIYLKVEHGDIYWNYMSGLRTGNNTIYNSYLAYRTPVLNLYDDCTEIIINGIDDNYFGRYYINGEYARVIGDKIVWREHIFEKIPN